jgi:CheY-like chemotaxis protein
MLARVVELSEGLHNASVLPRTLAQHLRSLGAEVTRYTDGNLLLGGAPADYDFYIFDLMLPGVDGEQLLDILRRRSEAGVLVITGRLGTEVFSRVLHAGADMLLTKPVQFKQVEHAVEPVYRRSARVAVANGPWRLDRRERTLTAPDGATVALAESDIVAPGHRPCAAARRPGAPVPRPPARRGAAPPARAATPVRSAGSAQVEPRTSVRSSAPLRDARCGLCPASGHSTHAKLRMG